MERIILDEKILAGKPIIKGTRIAVEHILDELGSGMSVDEVAAEHKIKREDILAAVSYAARSLRNEEILPA